MASAAANECYVDLRLLPKRASTALFQDLPQECRAESAEKVRRVTFMGALEPRKGVPDLLAAWIKKTGHKKLRANTWRDVAILCPRKLWLRTMATALRRVGLPVAIQSESDLKGDNPAYAWLTALCTIMVDPRNAYEIVGVLREVFGLADHDLAIFSEGEGGRFQIDVDVSATGVVSSPLRLLAETQRQIAVRFPLNGAGFPEIVLVSLIQMQVKPARCACLRWHPDVGVGSSHSHR